MLTEMVTPFCLRRSHLGLVLAKVENSVVKKLILLILITRGSNGYAQIDVRFPDKNDKSVQTR